MNSTVGLCSDGQSRRRFRRPQVAASHPRRRAADERDPLRQEVPIPSVLHRAGGGSWPTVRASSSSSHLMKHYSPGAGGEFGCAPSASTRTASEGEATVHRFSSVASCVGFPKVSSAPHALYMLLRKAANQRRQAAPAPRLASSISSCRCSCVAQEAIAVEESCAHSAAAERGQGSGSLEATLGWGWGCGGSERTARRVAPFSPSTVGCPRPTLAWPCSRRALDS
jgi:hypothetical protein